MKIFFELVSVGIPLTVEVLKREPVGFKNLLDNVVASHADSIEKVAFKLVVCKTVVGTGADIIEIAPEFFGNS